MIRAPIQLDIGFDITQISQNLSHPGTFGKIPDIVIAIESRLRQDRFMMSDQTVTSGPFQYNGVDGAYAKAALVRQHLFPAVKERYPELPIGFTSEHLSDEVINLMLKLPKEDRGWFSPTRFTALKFNGAIRGMQVPHPLGHVRLASFIGDHWEEIGTELNSTASRVVPNLHEDGRLVTMDYGDTKSKTIEESELAIGAKIRVELDIANCFPSVYTHAIDWAVRTKPVCKTQPSSSHWASELDAHIRKVQDGETSGIAIGPATSNIVAELILQKVDERLLKQKFRFVRHVDDYKCYVESPSDAERFVTDLTQELYEYRLSLNTRKTRFVDIMTDEMDGWIGDLHSLKISESDDEVTLIRKLRRLVGIANTRTESSVFNYALTMIKRSVHLYSDQTIEGIAHELARLIWIAPHTISRVVDICEGKLNIDSRAADILGTALEENLHRAHRRREVDVVSWSIDGMYRLGMVPNRQLIAEVVAWNPLIAALALEYFPKQSQDEVRNAASSVITTDRIDLHENWILRYQSWLNGLIPDSALSPTQERHLFELFKNQDVTFTRKPVL